MEAGQLLRDLVAVEVSLVEDYDCRNLICLAGKQYPVQEGEFELREVESADDDRLVEVGGNDVVLPGKIGGFAYDVVAAGMDEHDRGRVLGGGAVLILVVHYVAHGHRIGGIGILEPHTASQHGREELSSLHVLEQVMAARVLCDLCLSFHLFVPDGCKYRDLGVKTLYLPH